MIDRLGRVLRVARWEVARAGGGVDRRTLLAALALLLVAGAVLGGGLAVGAVGLDVDRDVYRVAVDGDSPYADAVDEAPALTPVPVGSATLGETADLVVLDVGRGESGAVETVAVRASDTRKGEAAAAEFREAVEAHNERLMADEENATAAFPVAVTLRYVGRTSALDDGSTLGEASDGSGGDDGSDGDDGSGGDDGSDGRGGSGDGSGSDGTDGDDDAGGGTGDAALDGGASGDGSGSDGTDGDDDAGGGTGDAALDGGASGDGFAVPSVGGGTFGADTAGSPGSISPPFPFVSLLLAFVFLVPMNFLIQAYGSSVLDERTNRRGEPLLVTPLSPVDIVAGKTLPYVAAALLVTTVIAVAVGGGALSVIAVLPVALTFLAATFVGAMFARSFKELTFVTVGVSVLLTTYAFVPAVFTNVTPVALVSPLTLVVFDLQGEAVSVGEALFSTGPMALGAALLFGLGLGVYREEDMFTQKPVTRKLLDALAVRLSAVDDAGLADLADRRRLRALGSVAFLTACAIPFVFVAELLAVATLFALPVTVSVPVLLVTIAFIEEVAKSVGLYAGFERGVFARADRVAVAVGLASAVGFFLAEKATAVVQAVGLTELYVGQAAFGSVAGVDELSPVAAAALLFAPLLLHGFATTVAAVGASRDRTAYALTLALATLLHAAYNFGVVSVHG
ncbi:ABC transporter permease [Halorubrum sp. Ea8]|uniref:ABC transporter permease n=1 Tax=Halorubrum sp. Ea8 TaxID=1383841 RepID=UPI000B99408D|nr:ABC transporter permease [Halorubrum sp. Ea8]OYR52164.1 PrsW family intramembrane metalloprotease [Halorubrum sp. Ea8]